MHLAFYKAASGNTWDKLIGFWTRGKYSHVEMWMDEPVHAARCFSSSPRDGGTRYKIIDLTTGKWDAIALPFTDLDRWIVERHIAEQVQQEYDWWGILGFVLPGARDSDARFCSEICLELIQTRGFLLKYKPSKVSPVKLAAIATPLWGAPVPVSLAAKAGA